MLTPEQKGIQKIKNLGTGMLGKKHSEEAKEKIRRAMKGKKPSQANREAVSKSNKTRIVSEKTRRKMSETRRGRDHSGWKGGVVKYKNRIFIHSFNHPNARNSYVRRAHLVAETALGRFLNIQKGEMVHHINGDPSNDRNENLLICDHKYHSWLHAKMKNYRFGQNATKQEFPE